MLARALLKHIFQKSAASSDLSDGQVSMEEYLDLKKKLSVSESRVQQLLTMNKQLNQDVHMLQSMVDKLKEENAKLLVLQRGKDVHPKVKDLESLPSGPKPGPKPSIPSSRPKSMFEPRAHQKPATKWKPSVSNPNAPSAAAPAGSSEGAKTKDTGKDTKSPLPVIGLPTIQDDQNSEGTANKEKAERPPSETGSEYDNALPTQAEEDKSTPKPDSPASVPLPSPSPSPNSPAPCTPPAHSSSSPEPDGETEDGAETKKAPTQEAVVGTTEKITRRIQTLLQAAQEGKLDKFVSCSDNIYATVTDMVELFPEKPKSEEVRVPLRLLVSSASRLRVECQSAVPADPSITPDLKHLTNQIIACAYDIAKAAKQLVTSFQ